MQNEVSARVTHGQQVLQNNSNYGDIGATSSYILAKDSTYASGDDDDLSDTSHAKTTARIKSIAILKECFTTKQFQYTQHIPLPKQVRHTFATASNSNNIFYSFRVSLYAGGAWMMHTKLVVDVGNNYYHKECLLDRPVLVAYNVLPIGPEKMLDSIPEAGNLQNSKRTCCNHGN
eukprot:10868277-Ditylum_brightwellii.AAC.1